MSSFRFRKEKSPRIWKMLAHVDVSYITRAPVDFGYVSGVVVKQGSDDWDVMYEEYDPIHNSHNITYKTGVLRECKSVPVPGSVLRYLYWRWDPKSSEQVARPYLPINAPRACSVYVRESYVVDSDGVRAAKPKASYVLHADVAEQRVEAPADIGVRIALAARQKNTAEVKRLYEIFESSSDKAMAYYQFGAG